MIFKLIQYTVKVQNPNAQNLNYAKIIMPMSLDFSTNSRSGIQMMKLYTAFKIQRRYNPDSSQS